MIFCIQQHHSDVVWVSWCLKSPTIRQFVQRLVQVNNKATWKLCIPFVRGTTVGIPLQTAVKWKVFPCHDVSMKIADCTRGVYSHPLVFLAAILGGPAARSFTKRSDRRLQHSDYQAHAARHQSDVAAVGALFSPNCCGLAIQNTSTGYLYRIDSVQCWQSDYSLTRPALALLYTNYRFFLKA